MRSLLCVLVLVLVSGCGGIKKDLIGKWQETDKDGKPDGVIVEFQSDGTLYTHAFYMRAKETYLTTGKGAAVADEKTAIKTGERTVVKAGVWKLLDDGTIEIEWSDEFYQSLKKVEEMERVGAKLSNTPYKGEPAMRIARMKVTISGSTLTLQELNAKQTKTVYQKVQ